MAKRDLSIKQNADISRNKTALICMTITTLLLAAAYFLEVLKDARTIGDYAILAATCLVPPVIGWIMYKIKKDNAIIRYVLGVGFLVFYSYLMFNTTSALAFCYIAVAFIVLIVYVDMKLSIVMSVYAFLLNVAVIIKMAVTAGLSAEQISNTEIQIAFLIFMSVFGIVSISKVAQIGKVTADKADEQRVQSEKLLQTTLEVATSITGSIEVAATETDTLGKAIEATKYAMEDLSGGAGDTAAAIAEQQCSTEEIDGYIKGVGSSTEEIVAEIGNTEDSINVADGVMNELLEQVKVSEEKGALVAKEMDELKEYATQMVTIVNLISKVARQTSMLALNASIEAARAGEAGKGFAVVAGEISDLASQTNHATDDINNLIGNVGKSLDEVVEAVNELLESNQNQNEFVGQTAEHFREIENSARKISEQAVQLKEAVESASAANSAVVESIQNVSAVTEEVSASAIATLESCDRNQESIQKLAEIMENLRAEAVKLQQED
ncbi:MAG: hypothetical protein IJ397_02040 [Lachnospiraceae bacterium]|nr:hypothetical protein [Lachnospiraceae bacterium]